MSLSVPHEGLLLPFQQRPQLAAELLGNILRAQPAAPLLPTYDSVAVVEANLTQIVPTEYRADLVVLHRSHHDRPDDEDLGIVIEVQLHQDKGKEYTWPLYAAAVRAKHQCRSCVLVVTPSAEVAAWAAKPIQVGPAPSDTFQAIVCGPSAIPCIVDPDTAKRNPELAFLSAKAHGMGPKALDVGKAAIAAAETLIDADYWSIYTTLVMTAVPPAVRALLEEQMLNLKDWEWLPRNRAVEILVDRWKAEGKAQGIAEGLVEGKAEGLAKGKAEGLAKGKAEGLAKGKAEGLAEGKAEGLAEGKAEGLAEGKAEGLAEALMRLLNARHIALTAKQRKRILTCRDPNMLDDWITRAAVATSANDVLQ